jgi:hypothetical protein
MYKQRSHIVTIALLAMLTAAPATHKYSGIYQGDVGGILFWASITSGGRILALDETSQGMPDVTNPYKSKVDGSGRFKAVVYNGTKIAGKIDSKNRIIGTMKQGKQTYRLAGIRTLK